MVIGEIAYQVAYDKVGTLYHGGFISGKSAGSFFHWIIRTVVFVAIWAVTYGVIWIGKFVMAHKIQVTIGICISKWEADIALPEMEKLLILGELFHISMDVLLKDELTLSEVKEVHSCGNNAIQGKKQEVYEGVLIKESVADDSIIDFMNVHKIGLWNTGGKLLK